MVDDGSKGHYNRRSDDKLAWRGIASIKIPSYWTSTTDTKASKVEMALAT